MNSKYLFFFLIKISIVKFSFSISQVKNDYDGLLKTIYDDFPTLTVNELKNKMANQKVVILDSREKIEFETSHIKNAIWVGFNNFQKDKLKKINKNAFIVVYCSVGARSQTIGKILKKEGFKHVYNLYGGIFQWVNENNKVYSKNRQIDQIHGYNNEWSKWIVTEKYKIF